MRYFIDCEFDGHHGDLISMALVPEEGEAFYAVNEECYIFDFWVRENVIPVLEVEEKPYLLLKTEEDFGEALKEYLGPVESIKVIADSPVDIVRFLDAISTDASGDWAPSPFKHIETIVVNVDSYPTDIEGATQHNAYWDAMALKKKITGK